MPRACFGVFVVKIVSEKAVLFPEALEMMEKRQKQAGEGTASGALGYEQQNTLTYLTSFSQLSAKDAHALFKELTEAGLTEKQAVSVCNLLPKREDMLQAVLASDKAAEPVAEDKLKEILKTVKKY